MSLSIRTNMQGIKANGSLKSTNVKMAKSSQKLSTGFRINNAADDAAGLSISEKMRGQIRGLNQAHRNIQDGISLVNTADGGLGMISDILHRMRELSTFASTDTLTEDDRTSIQMEIDQLRGNINEIANNTHFNGINLLGVPSSNETSNNSNNRIDLSKVESITFYEVTGWPATPVEISIEDLINNDLEYYWQVPTGIGEIYKFSIDLVNNTVTATALSYPPPSRSLMNITGVRLNGISGYEEDYAWASGIVDHSPAVNNPENSLGSNLNDSPTSSNQNVDNFITWEFKLDGETTEDVVRELVIQTGANSNEHYLIELVDVRTQALGLDPFLVDPREAAEKSINQAIEALRKVTSDRSQFGAAHNALEHISNNVSNRLLNETASESRIRDADMAKEVLKNTKHNILSNVAISMLSLANQNKQSVLSLLQ